ncbi:MAG: carboxypeptidase-like regulatory domain-containing protein, partial [Polyangiales bacterium]
MCALLVGCGGDDSPCDPVAQSGCDDGAVCEQVSGGEATCFAPVLIRGRVIDLGTSAGVAGARVVAVDINGAAMSGVAVSGADGKYALTLPAQRAEDGTPAAFPVSLRADAAGYESFPGTLRQALPIDTATAIIDGDGYVVTSTLTDIGLFGSTVAAAGSIRGHAAVPDDHAGILVVAEAAGVGHAVIAARDGDYQIFNLPAGHYTVTAYSLGHVYAALEVDVASAAVAADLALSADSAGTLTG